MHPYGAKNSDHQIQNSPIPTKSQFTKFNARQIFPIDTIQYLSFTREAQRVATVWYRYVKEDGLNCQGQVLHKCCRWRVII